MPKSKLPQSESLPNLEEILSRFSFIEDETMKTNLSITLQYVIFLINLENDYDLPGTAKYLIFKDIILHTASIVECILNYTLQNKASGNPKLANEIVTSKQKYRDVKEIYKISQEESVVASIRYYKQTPINNDVAFKRLNEIAKNIGLFSEDLFSKCEELRVIRNKIHLCGLDDVDGDYTKEDIENIFKDAKQIIDVCESDVSKKGK